MIFQGLFNCLDLYFEGIQEFYNTIDIFFHEKINDYLKKKNLKDLSYNNVQHEILLVLKEELMKIGFNQEKIDNYFQEVLLIKQEGSFEEITSTLKIYSREFSPIVYELFLEQIIDYLVESKSALIILNLKYKGFFPTEFILELRNLKKLIQESPDKLENLRKYVHIQGKIVEKFLDNKKKIEILEDLKDPRDKLQLVYSIFRIIDFFHLLNEFDFSHIKTYLEKNIEEWLTSFPLITLRNPDLYFCGIYLANHLNIKIDIEKVNNFLLTLFEECIDEFEAPLFEATDRLYYFLKSTEIVKLWLDDEKIGHLIKDDPRMLEPNYFKDFETSQLVVILKIYALLGVSQKIETQKIEAIYDEIEMRVTPGGIKQYRDGFVTSESTYYVLFVNYMRNTLEKLKDYVLLDSIVPRIYRNLEFLDFSGDTNFDLVSELFYSCESLKLFNCIETKHMIHHLAKYLFPEEVVNKIISSEGMAQVSPHLRHYKVNKVTGETIY
ncbi:MAG: hypothetical protein JW891_06390 [Candidatus Lokiarchaeota archaeon]|nr:hypothetical protein [Candidatus Lokiarchaeota archaeon]